MPGVNRNHGFVFEVDWWGLGEVGALSGWARPSASCAYSSGSLDLPQSQCKQFVHELVPAVCLSSGRSRLKERIPRLSSDGGVWNHKLSGRRRSVSRKCLWARPTCQTQSVLRPSKRPGKEKSYSWLATRHTTTSTFAHISFFVNLLFVLKSVYFVGL